MQIDLGTLVTLLTIVAVQIGTTIALKGKIESTRDRVGDIVERLDKQNGRIGKMEDCLKDHEIKSKEYQLHHIEEFHLK